MFAYRSHSFIKLFENFISYFAFRLFEWFDVRHNFFSFFYLSLENSRNKERKENEQQNSERPSIWRNDNSDVGMKMRSVDSSSVNGKANR
jgi:hypothetical protein